MNGASNSKVTGVGIILATLEGFIIDRSFTLGFAATNNEVEYEVVIAGLRIAMTLGVTGLEVCCDSTLVVCQVNGKYAAKDEWLAAYLQLVLALKSKFFHCDFKQVPRSENNHADSLATLALAVDFQFRREIPVS